MSGTILIAMSIVESAGNTACRRMRDLAGGNRFRIELMLEEVDFREQTP